MDNIVKKHIEYFANKDSSLTDESMRNGHDKQDISKGVGLKIRAIKNMMVRCPHTVGTLLDIENPARTGIWNTDGTFNEKVFKQVEEYSTKISYMTRKTNSRKRSRREIKIITKKGMMAYLESVYTKNGDTGNACRVFYVVPVSWKRITQGSIDKLFEYYSDIYYGGERALTIPRLREFYTDPVGLMKKREKFLKDGDTSEGIFYK